ncbi:hypothetical protein SFC08_16845 [Lysinibacillus halotolerans]
MEENSLRELQRVVIKEEFYVLTGDHYEAALINNLIFWRGIVDKTDKNLLSRIKVMEQKGGNEKQITSLKNKLRNGWFYKTGEEITNELMGWGSNSKVTRAINKFVENDWLEKGNNPDPKKKWDRTNWYRVNLEKIAQDLYKLGYALEGYTLIKNEPKKEEKNHLIDYELLIPLIFQNEKCNFQNEKCNFHFEISIFQNERTIPEGFKQKVFKEGFIEEEDEASHSDLIKFLISKNILIENAIKFEAKLQEEMLTDFTYEQIEKAIEWSLKQFEQGKCYEPYSYAVGRLKRMLDGKLKEISLKPESKGTFNKKSKEIIPDWLRAQKDPEFAKVYYEQQRKKEENNQQVEFQKQRIEILKKLGLSEDEIKEKLLEDERSKVIS